MLTVTRSDSRFRALHPNLTKTPAFSGDCEFRVWAKADTVIAWDSYQANRYRILDHIYDNQIDNVAVFTGDSHANW